MAEMSKTRAAVGVVPQVAWRWAFLALLVWLILPRPMANTDSPAVQRALATIEAISASPHPMGTPEHSRVRNYLMDQLARTGANPEIQDATIVYDHPRRGTASPRVAQVGNIVGRLGVNNEGPALLLMSHYDSQAVTPGAGDASTGVAAVLEAARVLAETELRREVVILLTDGEEFGLFGAQAFFRQHPLAQDIGLVLNFEARGSAGPVYMFETGDGNAPLINAFRAAVDRPNANSMAYEIYQRMPNDTDFTIAKQAGIPGLNFAFIDGFPDYHSATDTAGNLNRSSVAEMVLLAIQAATYFATAASLPETSEPATYFEVVPGWSVQISSMAALFIGFASIVVALLWLIRQRHVRAVGLRALAWSLVAGITLVLAMSNLWESLADALSRHGYGEGDGREWILLRHKSLMLGYVVVSAAIWFAFATHWIRQRMTLAPYWIMATLLVVLSAFADRLLAGFLVSAAFLAMAPYVRSRVSARSLFAASVVVWAAMTALVLWLMPQGAYLFALPLLFHVLGSWRQSEPMWKGMLAMVLTAILWIPILFSAYLGVGIWMPQFLVVVCALLFWLAVTVLTPAPSSRWTMALFVAGWGVVVWSLTVSPFDERRPRPESLYALEDAAGNAYWAIDPDAGWMQSSGSKPKTVSLAPWRPRTERSVVVTQRRPSGAAPARLDGAFTQQGDWQGVLHNSGSAEAIVLYFAETTHPEKLLIDGMDVPVGNAVDGWYRVRWFAPRHATSVRFSTRGAGLIRAVSRHYGLPEGAPIRPANSAPPRYSMSDSLWQVSELAVP